MNSKRLLSALVLIGTLCLSLNTKAALIDNGDHITDTTAGVDWLKLNATTNYSYDQLLIELQTGGDFEGWTLATFEEVYTLFDNAGGTGAYRSGIPFGGGVGSIYTTNGETTLADTLLPLWGLTLNDNISNQALFHIVDFSAAGFTTAINLFETGVTNFFEDGAFTSTTAESSLGAALFRQTVSQSVSEPSLLGLLGLALFGLVTSRRKYLKK